jgi:hypothetical protein
VDADVGLSAGAAASDLLLPVEPPSPAVPLLVGARLHWYPALQSESVVHGFAAAARLIPAVNTRVERARKWKW